MDPLSFFMAGISVYAGIAIFVIGMAYKIYCWLRTPKSSVKLGMFPRAKNGWDRGLRMVRDTFVFPQVLDNDRTMWFFVLLLHIVGLGTFIGHLRMVGEFQPLYNWLGAEGMEMVSFIGGGMSGIILLITVSYLLVRRFKTPYKEISVPEDYLLLLLILLIIVLGDHLRFFADFAITDYQAYVKSLLAFSPSFPAAIAASEARWVLSAHVFTASILLAYFPFSKLVHFVGSFAGNLIRGELYARTSR